MFNASTEWTAHARVPARRTRTGAGQSAVLAFVLVFTWPVRLHAQQAHSISLADAVGAAASRNPSVLLALRALDGGAGALMVARAAFDPQTQATVSGEQRHDLTTDAAAAPLFVRSTATAYNTGVSKTYRSGVVITPSVGVTQTAGSVLPGIATNSATASFGVLVPLLRGRGDAVAAKAEQAAESDLSAGRWDARQAAAKAVYDVAGAYWNYAAAVQRQRVYALATARARQMVVETSILVRADERTTADLAQVRAVLAAKRALNIGAAQAVIDARRTLGLTMGISPSAVATLGTPSTALPRASGSDSTNADEAIDAFASDSAPSLAFRGGGGRGDASDSTATLARDAFVHRPDLAALGDRRRSAAYTLSGAANDLRPRVDLNVVVGYGGYARGWGAGNFLSPLGRNVPGVNTSVELRLQLPANNLAARGRLMQIEAADAQLRVSEEDLRRSIETGVAASRRAVEAGERMVRASGAAVTLSSKSVDAQRELFKAGLSTMFDVLVAQEDLMNAELQAIDGQVNYAIGLASFRYETGDAWREGDNAIDAATRLVTP